MTLPRLPALREELALHTGPALGNGQPSWTLEDPVRSQFFRIDWQTFEILLRWSLGTSEDILLSIRSSTTLQLEAEDIHAVAQFLKENQLLQPDPKTSPRMMAERYQRQRGSYLQQGLHHYLFFRLPLLKPDRWLSRLAPAFDWVYSRFFLRLTLLALLVGIIQVYRDWDRFSATLIDTFSLNGIIGYALALTGVKFAHELGHAITAKRHACRIPTMGLAFLVLWPVPYTDTNEVWRLDNSQHRLQVAAAGILTELFIAVWSTLAWSFLPDGILRSVAFLLATTTWITTLAINLSPFMRFDGYFLLSDWLDIPNLHERAFALARWDLRERLFAPGAQPPEHFPPRRQTGLILFAWATWLYRLVVFLGIAALVYHFFIKFIGILLFCVEITWFIARPILNELRAWRKLWPAVRRNRRSRYSLLLLCSLILLFAIPWPSRIQSTGILRNQQIYPVYAPLAARVATLPFAEGASVAKGQVMLNLAAPALDSKKQATVARVTLLRWQLASAGFDMAQQARIGVLREELATAEAELQAIDQEAAHYHPVAPFDGRLRDIDPELAPGAWVGRQEKLAVLVGNGNQEVDAYLDESVVQRIAIGNDARFYPDGLEGPFIRLVIRSIDQDASRTLPSGIWAAQQGGAILAREKSGIWYPEQSVFHVTLAAQDQAGRLAGHSWRGKVVIAGEWEAPGKRFLRTALSVLWRELGF